ncbi:uncharacterized protein HaLaN_10224 [Haematococcus lacustris]|uniref:Uncharacterized protein n=1 Tax=Haematococcus lacustris TaxID=44745 RepID=A0A699Z564_HAELA|nr:uncharacterized protein HaLaN_10224 [Haematococcus lacustris]
MERWEAAGRAVREAGTGLAAVPDRLQRELRAQFDAIVTAVRSEAMRAAMTRSSEEGAALAQLSSQLAVGGQVMWGSAALNGALTGLEVAQGEGLRRMTLTLSSNLVDAEAALQVAPNAGEVAVARLEGEQWEALGKRLSRMEQLMEGIPRVLEARQQSVEEGLGVRLGQLQQEVQGVRQGLEGLLTSTQAMKWYLHAAFCMVQTGGGSGGTAGGGAGSCCCTMELSSCVWALLSS